MEKDNMNNKNNNGVVKNLVITIREPKKIEFLSMEDRIRINNEICYNQTKKELREKFDRTKPHGNIADIGTDKNLTPEEKLVKFVKRSKLMTGIATGPKSQQSVEKLLDSRMQELVQEVLEQYALEQYVLEQQEKSSGHRK